MLDMAYVGNRSLHQLQRVNINTVPFGSAWLPQNQDPTNANPTTTGTTTLPINYYRPYLGYGDITIRELGGMSNYNGLQLAVNRRFGNSFTFGANYTWGKALGTAGARDENLHPFNFKMANYGPLYFDVRHTFVFNYQWNLPNGARGPLDNVIGRAFFNGWEISGVTSFFTGEPDFITIGDLGGPGGVGTVSGDTRNRVYTGSQNITPRPYFVGDPNGNKEIYAWIDPSTLMAPVVGSQGLESGQRPVRKPGVNNWDISVFKNFPLGSEKRSLQLRCEMFNAWNHTQFSDFNRTVNFNAAGQITNLPSATNRFGFGAVTAARDPRIIQLAAKIYF